MALIILYFALLLCSFGERKQCVETILPLSATQKQRTNSSHATTTRPFRTVSKCLRYIAWA